jgi:hypothetical protein
MTTPQFEKVNLAWRLQQLQQNLGEWWELQWRRWFGSLPDVQAPSIEDPEFWARLVANSLIFCLFALLFLEYLAIVAMVVISSEQLAWPFLTSFK